MRNFLRRVFCSPQIARWAAMALGLFVLGGAIILHLMDLSRLPSLSQFDSKPIGGDFWAFHSAARLVAAGLPWGAYVAEMNTSAMASVVTNVNSGTMVWGLYYPPTYLFVLWPFGFLPYYPALLAFFLMTLTVFLGGIWLLTRRPWLTILMLAFTGVVLNFVTGQNGLLTAGLFAIALALMERHKNLSGFVIGLLSVKPQLGLLLPFALLAGRERQVFKIAAITTLVLLGASLAAFSLVTWILWPEASWRASTYLTNRIEIMFRMPSVLSTVRLSNMDWLLSYVSHGWLTKPQAAMLLHFLVGAPVAGMVIYIWRRTENVNLRGAGYAAGTLLITPFLYDYDQAWLAIPIVLLGLEAGRTGWWWPERFLLPIAMAWPLLVSRFPEVIHIQIGFLMPLLLVLLTFRRTRREPKNKGADQTENALNQQT